jgi:hypothetical protein
VKDINPYETNPYETNHYETNHCNSCRVAVRFGSFELLFAVSGLSIFALLAFRYGCIPFAELPYLIVFITFHFASFLSPAKRARIQAFFSIFILIFAIPRLYINVMSTGGIEQFYISDFVAIQLLYWSIGLALSLYRITCTKKAVSVR